MRPELAQSGAAVGSAGVASSSARAVVIDTNIVLDLLVFADPHSQALAQALSGGALHWLATPAMREELSRVLAYPQIAQRLDFYGLSHQAVLTAFDAQARLVEPPAAAAPFVCKDGDDQKFIDLAAAHGAVLLSKDKAVLCMRKRLQTLGVSVAAQMPTPGP